MYVLKLRTFLSRPLQNNNLKSSKFAWSQKGNPTAHYLSFHLALHAAVIRYAEINLWRSKSR